MENQVPISKFTGNVEIGKGSYITTGVRVLPKITIERWVTIGTDSGVIKRFQIMRW